MKNEFAGSRWLFAAMLSLGFVAAAGTYSLVVPAVAEAESGPCENDECELGQFCEDNPGGNTGCAMSGSQCSTYGC